MRHKFLKTVLALLLLMGGVKVAAQVGTLRSDFSIGGSAGITLDKVSFKPSIKQDWKIGKTFGVTMRYVCEKYFNMICALQAEVNFAQLGWKERIETSDDTYERTINYLQVPLLAKLGFGREVRGFQGYLILGPQLGFYLSDSEKRTGEWSLSNLIARPNGVVKQYDLEVQNKFDYGITGGAGAEISTAIGHFTLDARYNFALSDIFRNSKQDPFGRSAHGAITIKLGYLFDLAKTKGVTRK